MRLIYIDDSGSEPAGIVVYGWVEVDEAGWRQGLGSWLDWREAQWLEHRVGKTVEIHSTSFVNGRGRPSLDDAWNASKAARRAAFDDAFARLARGPHLEVGAVYSRTTKRRGDYRAEKMRVYAELVALLDARCAHDGALGIIVMDGDGTDQGYAQAHRALRLSRRSIIEDPLFQHSNRSHWLQMADMIAYAAYQEVLAEPAKAFAHHWFPMLRGVDVLGGPRQV